MQNGSFTEDDISTAKRAVISGLLQISDSPAAIEAFKFRRFLAGVDESPAEVMKKINAVSKEEIVAVAKKVRFDSVYFLCGNGEGEDDDE